MCCHILVSFLLNACQLLPRRGGARSASAFQSVSDLCIFEKLNVSRANVRVPLLQLTQDFHPVCHFTALLNVFKSGVEPFLSWPFSFSATMVHSAKRCWQIISISIHSQHLQNSSAIIFLSDADRVGLNVHH